MNKRHFLAFAWVFVLFLSENFLRPFFPDGVPFALLLGVIFYSLSEGPDFGFVIGLFGGFLTDTLLAGPIGPASLAFSLAGFSCGLFSAKVFRESILTQLFLPFAASLALSLVSGFTARSLRDVFLTTALSPLLFLFLKKVSFVRPERTPWN